MLRATLIVVLLAAGLPALAGPEADDALYTDYDRLLRAHVDAQGMVDYAGLQAEQRALEACVTAFAAVDADALSGAAKMAYWINVYNAVTLQQVVKRLPLRSIKALAPVREGGFHVWESPVFQGKSLNAIEHEILRPLGDPRIHAAIVCASIGCPPLRAEAYLPSKLDAQLDQNVRTWLASPERGLKITGTTAHLSAIFDWFGDDFAKDQASRLAWIGRFLTPERRAQLQQAKAVKSLDWDWALNRQPERRPAAPR